jgi:hypothetical protein
MGYKVSNALDSDTVSEMKQTFLDYANNGQLDSAVLFAIQTLKDELRGLTPADVMLIVTMVS